MSVYQFSAERINGEAVDLSEFSGKVLLIVNTATECGFTSQLEGLENLYRKFMHKGLEILAFPSNDFAKQEPRKGKDIQEFCEKFYGVSFPIFKKIRVRGNNAHPLYRYLSKKSLNGRVGTSPKWNFHKYLINKEGNVVDHFYVFTRPESKKLVKSIEKLINDEG